MIDIQYPALVRRIAIGKSIGLLVGVIGFFTLPLISPDSGLMLRWGFLLWYVTLGAIIAIFGIMDRHPFLAMPMPWWINGPFVGGWMNFVLAFFGYDTIARMMLDVFGPGAAVQSPFWIVLEGAVFGLLVGYAAARFGGEGKATFAEQL